MAKAKPLIPPGKESQAIEELLRRGYWPSGLEIDKLYRAQTDDSDGDPCKGHVRVSFGRDGDAYISTTDGQEARFRLTLYGTGNPLVRNALLILAEAMRLQDVDKAAIEEKKGGKTSTE